MPVKESQEPKELVEFVSDEQLKSFIEEWDRYDKDQNGLAAVMPAPLTTLAAQGPSPSRSFWKGRKPTKTLSLAKK